MGQTTKSDLQKDFENYVKQDQKKFELFLKSMSLEIQEHFGNEKNIYTNYLDQLNKKEQEENPFGDSLKPNTYTEFINFEKEFQSIFEEPKANQKEEEFNEDDFVNDFRNSNMADEDLFIAKENSSTTPELPSIFPVKNENIKLRTDFDNNYFDISGATIQKKGLDIMIPYGSSVMSTADGKVVKTKVGKKAYGNYIIVRHANGISTLYAHLSKINVKKGDKVKQGQAIALSGESGRVKYPTLHYQIRMLSVPVNPSIILKHMSDQ